MSAASHDARFAAWCRDHAGILHRVVRAFAAGSDRPDLMQEVLLALWRAAPAFNGASAPATFIYRVAHNTALLWHRGERRHQRRVAAAPEIDWMVNPGTGADRDGTAARLEALYLAIQTLPPLDRSLVLLSLDGLSYRAIADIHGLTESNVGARLTRARQRLAATLHQEETA